MNKSWVIFDVDGVLLNSLDNMVDAWSKVCDKYNLSIPFESYKKHIWKPFEVIMLELWLSHLLPEIKNDYFSFSVWSEIRPRLYHGTLDVLEYLSNNWIKTWIITSKAKESLDKILDEHNIRWYFNSILTPPVWNHSLWKPNPFLALEFLDETWLSKDDVVYIWDMESDREFAYNSWIDYIHHSGWYGWELSNSIVIHINNIKELIWLIQKK